jgi:hypothetical protein
MAHPDYKDIGHPAVRLIEECSELIKVLSKGMRFGWDNHHPKRKSTNLEEAEMEFRDVQEAWGDFMRLFP